MMKNNLLLLSKNDIPFIEAQVNIHQPTISEISLIGEENFQFGCRLLTFSKENLSYEDRKHLTNQTDFEIFMSMMEKEFNLKNSVSLVLMLLFPEYSITFSKGKIFLKKEEYETSINSANFDAFKDILKDMFVLSGKDGEEDYNPADRQAEKIAEKLRRGRVKAAANKGQDIEKSVNIFNQYVSILAVGEKKDINLLMEYTVYQLKDEFERFKKKEAYDAYVKAMLAGCSDLEEVDHWMNNIHS